MSPDKGGRGGFLCDLTRMGEVRPVTEGLIHPETICVGMLYSGLGCPWLYNNMYIKTWFNERWPLGVNDLHFDQEYRCSSV